MNVKCIDASDADWLTEGKIYAVVKEQGGDYLLLDDDNFLTWSSEERFETVL